MLLKQFARLSIPSLTRILGSRTFARKTARTAAKSRIAPPLKAVAAGEEVYRGEETKTKTTVVEISPPKRQRTLKQAIDEEEELEEEKLKYPEYTENLVVRPPKGFLWGMGAQLAEETKGSFLKGIVNQIDYFKETKDGNPALEETLKFLNDFQLKEIDVIYLQNFVERGLPEINVIAVGESAGHIFRAARAYIAEVKKIGSEDSQYAQIVGGKNDDYLMLMTRPMAVHLVTVDSKDEHDIRGMLLDLPTYEEEKEHEQTYKAEVKTRKDKRRSRKWEKKVEKAPDY